jgi:subtilisin family serine protease
MVSRFVTRSRLPLVAAAAAVALVGSVVTLDPAGAAPAKPAGNDRLSHHPGVLNSITHGVPRALQNRSDLPAGVPHHGQYAFLLRLGTASTFATYRHNMPLGKATARTAAKSQFDRIKTAQASVISALPRGSHVLYKTHAVVAGVAVRTDVHDYGALQRIAGVAAVYPIAAKTISNSYAVPLVHAPQVWASAGNDLGQNSTIAIIDTGIDYTHANLGGSGNPADYTTALANDTADPTFPDTDKIVGGRDFAGDAYDASDPAHSTPVPDNNPLDCNDHGSHVAGTAAGYGENPDGTQFTGDYTTLGALTTQQYQDTFRIGPGMAPKAHILAYKVFGCEGSTDVVGAAIDAAADPNADGDPSDHADVINMSLGADYGSPQDGDSVASNVASNLGITVVVASGNGGDYYDVGGSPGDAVRTLAVANSVDAYSQIDSLHVTFNGDAQDPMGAQRSVAYDWAHDPDLSGTVAVPLSGNSDGCDTLSTADAATVNGKIAFLEWTDNDAVRRCGSVARSKNVADAGAVGAIFADDQETFAAGITGSATIPVVQVVKSAGDDIRDALTTNAGTESPVVVTGTSAGDFRQLLPQNDDQVNTGSSRGIRGAGNVKPDVTAVGTSVFSTARGTGDQGVSFSGTSMATPMVAGLAALVRTVHKDWTPEQVKADIMNTAGQDLRTGDNHTGTVYAPNRVGAGRIQADAALDNLVVAYVKDDPGAVSVSFGPVAVTGKMTLTKTVNVVNKSPNPATYTLAYHSITAVPGVSYQVSPSTLTLGAAATKTFTVKFVVNNPALLTKTHDTTVDLSPGGLPREFLADASGRVILTPDASNGAGAGTALRVPVYSAPRPASTMTEPGTIALSGSGTQSGSLTLSGKGVNQGSGNATVKSFVSGFERQVASSQAPACAPPTVQDFCVHYADERSADLKYVGTTSDYNIWKLAGDTSAEAFQDAEAYFSITVQRPWRSPVGIQEFDILLDTNNDGVPDAVVYNTRLGAEDIFLSELIDISDPNPANWFIRDDELINDRFGSTNNTISGADTALFDSDTMVLPVWIEAMGPLTVAQNGFTAPALPGFDRSHTRIHYAVETFGASGPVDSVGVNRNTGNLNAQRLSFDVIRPGVEVFNSSIATPPTAGFLLNTDVAGAKLTVKRNLAAYKADKGSGALLVHFHNKAGSKAKLLTLKTAPKVTLALSSTKVTRGHTLSVTVTVGNTAGATPTGKVTLHRPGPDLTKTLFKGKATFSWKPAATGTFSVYASYTGDANYASGKSATKTYKVVS